MNPTPLPDHLPASGFTARAALDAGVSAKRLRGRDLVTPSRGLRVAADASFGQRCIATMLVLPETARVAGVSAARIMGVPLPLHLEQEDVIHVVVPRRVRAPQRSGVAARSMTMDPTETRLWLGIRISNPARTWCELAPVLDVPDLVAAADYLVAWRMPLTTVSELLAATATVRRGAPKLRLAVPLVNSRSESRRESLLRVILIRAGVTGIEVNLPIRTSGGFSYRADLAFPARKLIIEYQSRFHEGAAFYKDMTRRSRLEADGWFVMEINAMDLHNPHELVQRVRTVLSARSVVR